MAIAVTIAPTGNPEIDGVLSGYMWSGPVTYSLPDLRYGDATSTSYTFAAVTTLEQQAAINWALSEVQAFTNIDLSDAGTSTSADIRIGNSSVANPTAYAYYPDNSPDGSGGDVWIGTQYDYQHPTLGSYEWTTHLHEIGHALGLKHPHETSGSFPALSLAHDDLEYSVMSYRSYIGQSTRGGYTNEDYGFPQTYMMNDIIALQAMYGANYTSNSGDNVYTWSPTTGEMFINGVGQGQPGGADAPDSANRIFLTIWDGNGNDTYDMSNYSTGVKIDLNPGSYSITSDTQRANLDMFHTGHLAQGNVYNAYLFNNDARSYIENAIGGSGNDTLIGNAVANQLDGGAGNDVLNGGVGDDVLIGGDGVDVFIYWSGYGSDTVTDFIAVGGTHDIIDLADPTLVSTFADVMADASQVNDDTVLTFGPGLTLTLLNVALLDLTNDDFVFSVTITGTANSDTIDATHAPSGQPFATAEGDTIYGMAGSDVIHGLAGNDVIDGGTGNDTLYGDDGNDRLTGGSGTDKSYGGNGDDSFFISGTNDISDVFSGGAGTDTVVVTTTVTLAGFNATASSIEGWQGNGQAVLGNSNANTFDFSGLSSVTGLTFVDGGSGNDKITGTSFTDDLRGNSGNDTLNGGGGNDALSGGAGSDTLNGGGNDDAITGGAGKDVMTGGLGADTFVFTATSDSTSSARDTITDFVEGTDKIDLHAIDANTTSGATGDQDFQFFGSSATAVANQITFTQSGGNTIVSADTNGNSTADIVIVLTGLHALTANDFIL